MNPYVQWIDWLWDLQANHLKQWIYFLWTVFQCGVWFGLGISWVRGTLTVRIKEPNK